MFSRILRSSLCVVFAVQAASGLLSAQTAPQITTGVATEVKDLSATLNGTLNVNSVGVWLWYFEIGSRQLYHNTNYTIDGAVTGSNSVPLTVKALTLLPETTYYYRLGARQVGNLDNEIFGETRSFTTGPPATPPSISAGHHEIGHNVAVMRGTLEPGSSPAKVFIRYGLSSAFGLRAELADPVFPHSGKVPQIRLLNLQPSSTYHYCWIATNAQGTATSEIRTFSTPAAPLVETLIATDVTSSSAVLNGRVNPRDGSTMSIYFDVGTTTSYSSFHRPDGLSSLSGNTTTDLKARITNLAPNTTYHFRLRCSQSNTENTTFGQNLTFTTGPAGNLPATESAPRAEEITGHSARVRVDGVSAGSSQATAIVEYGTTAQYGLQKVIQTVFEPLTSDKIASEKLENLVPGTTYHYRFRISNSSGFIYSLPGVFSIPAPPEVATLPAKNILDVTATLCGRIVTNGTPCEVRIEWGLSTGYGEWARLDFDPAQSLHEWTLAFPAATTIHYRLNVTDGKNVYLGQDQSFTTLPLIPKPPVIHSVRMDVARFSAFDPRPYVSWDFARVVVDSDGGTAPSTLVIEYGKTTAYGMVATTEDSWASPPGTSMLLKNLSPATTYHYRAKLSSALGTVVSGNFTFTTMAAPVLLPLPAVDVTDQGAVLAASLNPRGWFFYTEINYGLTPACELTASQINSPHVDGWRNGQIIGDVINLTAIPEALQPSTTYYYQLKCTTPAATVLTSAVGAFTTLPPSTPPQALGTATVTGITPETAIVTVPGVKAGSSLATLVFQYGTTTAYGSQVSYPGEMPAFWSGNPSVTLSGLAPSTLYHVRATIQNGQGQVQTENLTFTTLPPGAKPTMNGTLTANVMGASRATLNSGSISAGDGAATLVFDYGTTEAYGSQVRLDASIPAGSAASRQVLLQSLLPDTVYHFRCTASNAFGSVSTPNMVFTTLPRPVTTTLPASPVTDLSAALNASINAMGSSYNPSFEWGLTPSYGKAVAGVPFNVSGSNTTAVSASLSGLSPSTTYHYRVKAGQFLGNAMTFTTADASTLPIITGAVIPYNIKPDSASLKVATSIQPGGSETTISFEYGLTTAYGFEVTVPGTVPVGTTAAAPSVILTGLAQDTLYHGRFKATNGQGSTYSADTEFSTSFHVLSEPATEVTDISARVNGSVNAGGGRLFSLTFQWGTTGNYGNHTAAIPDTTTGTGTLPVSVILPGLLPDTLYYYRLVGYDGNWILHTSPQMTFRTAAAATPPSAPEPVVMSSVGLSTATARANNVRAGGAAATVTFEYGVTLSYGSVVNGPAIATSGSASPQVNLSGLSPATTYHIRCRVQSALGTRYSSDTTFTTPATPVLTTNAASGVRDMTATMNGEALYPGLTLHSFRFAYGTGGSFSNWRSTQNSTPGAVPGSYVFESNVIGLIPNTTYQYRLEADSAWGQTYVGTARTFTTGPASSPPTMNGSLVAGIVIDTKARLNPPLMWAGSSNASVVYDYGLTTSYGSTKTATGISFNQSSQASVELTNLQPARTYHVRCRVTNAQGVALSNSITFTTAATPVVTTLAPSSVTDITAILNGTVNPMGGTVNVGYEWGESSSSLSPLGLYGSDIARFQNVTGTSALPLPTPLLSNLKPSTTYYYRIRAFSSGGITVWNGSLLSFTTPPAATPPRLNGSLTVSSVTTRAAVATFKNADPTQSGAIFAGGSDATVSLQYGTTTSYGSNVTIMIGSNVAAGQSTTAAIGTMTGLLGGTQYHVRLKITSPLGTVYSENVTFTTLTDPVLVTGGVPAPGEFSAELSADATAGPGTVGLSVFFDWGLTESYGSSSASVSVAAGTSSQVSVSISGLSPGRTYHYRVKARYDTSPSQPIVWYYGENRSFTTAPASTPPRITTVPAASNIKSTTASILSGYFTGSSTTTVTLEYGTTTDYGSVAPLATNFTPNANTAGSVTLTGLLPETTYHVRAKAENAQGTAYGENASFTTAIPPVLALALPSDVTVSSAILKGTLVSGSTGVFSFKFEWGLTSAYGSSVNATGFTSLSAAISGLVPATTYHYRLVATDGVIVRVTENGSFISAPSPVPPVLGDVVSAYSITPTAATLWISSVSAPATVLFDYGLTTSYGSVAVCSQSTSPDGVIRNATVELANLAPGTIYHYRCRAFNPLGTTLGSTGTFRTLAMPGMFTGNPGGIAAQSVILNGEINARNGLLTPSFEFGTTTAYGSSLAIPARLISSATAEPVSLEVTGLLPETTYHFRLKARDPRGAEYFGEPMSVTTLTVAQAWRFKYFGVTDNTGAAADDANPSRDGISNLMKYALDMDPLKPAALPVMAGIRAESNGRRLGFSFVRDAGKRDITYLVEAANSPSGPWQPLAASIGGEPAAGPGFVGESDAGGSKRTVNVQDILDMSQAPARFMRLSVTRESVVRSLSETQKWRLRYFGITESTGTAADDANPSGDGISNLMKYALDMDPTNPTALPVMAGIRAQGNGRRLGFSFVRDAGKREISYLVEVSNSPAGPWSPLVASIGGEPATGPGFIGETDAGGSKRTVEVQDIIDVSQAPARFMHLRVTRDVP